LVAYTLFANGIPNGAQIYRMEANSLNLTIAASRYATLLPASIDIILLSMGSDGHIASLFAGSPAVRESRRRVLLVNGPRAPYQRLTLTPPVIKGAQHVFVIALGEEKRTMYEEARRDPSDVDRIPARLVLNRNWVFDVTRPNSQRL
jgi:6-phosphogluconolactonase